MYTTLALTVEVSIYHVIMLPEVMSSCATSVKLMNDYFKLSLVREGNDAEVELDCTQH